MTYEPKLNEYLMNGSIEVNKTYFCCVGNNDSLMITIRKLNVLNSVF